MKSKTLILLFVFFGLFFFLLPNIAEAGVCVQTCGVDDIVGTYDISGGGGPIFYDRLGYMADINCSGSCPPVQWASCSCGLSSSYYDDNKCEPNAFPSGDWDNDQSCTALDLYFSFPVGCKWWTSDDGKWDASDPDSGDGPACILCDGKTEANVLGYTSSKYCNDGSNHICAYNNDPDGDPGDTDCESACGADAACDEVTDGSQCTIGEYCEALGRNCQAGDKCSGCVCTSTPKPDLDITMVGSTDSKVEYTVKNIGNADAGSSDSELYVDGNSEEFDSVDSLADGSSVTHSFDYDWKANCTGDTDIIVVCADKDDDIDESDEDNNCESTILYCPKADLKITDIKEFSSDLMVYYNIKNRGEGDAADSYSELFVDNVSEDDDFVNDIDVEAGETSYNEYFNGWTCDPGIEYDIEVCADKDNDVDEEDEDNNCRTETLTCPEEECTGNVGLTLNPSSVEPSHYPVTATVSGLSGCDGKTAYIKYNSCSGTTECTCTVSGSGCSCYFTAPSSEGTYTYYACVDKNDDSDFSDSGESDWANLEVTPTPFDFSVSVSPGSGQVDRGDVIWTTVTANLLSGDPQTVTFSVTASTLPGNTSVGFYMDDHITPSDSCTLPCFREMAIITTIDTPLGLHENIEIKGSAGGESRYNYYDLTVNEIGEEIIPPIVETNGYENLTENSVTLKGRLVDCGRADTCLVWFEYATADYWNTNSSYSDSTLKQTVDCTTMTIPHDFDSGSEITGLTSGTPYLFEAFAKNGGSW